jgi:hypothetical protein
LLNWASGLEDIRRSFGNPDRFAVPGQDPGFVTHDVHRHEAGSASVSDTAEPMPAALFAL